MLFLLYIKTTHIIYEIKKEGRYQYTKHLSKLDNIEWTYPTL